MDPGNSAPRHLTEKEKKSRVGIRRGSRRALTKAGFAAERMRVKIAFKPGKAHGEKRVRSKGNAHAPQERMGAVDVGGKKNHCSNSVRLGGGIGNHPTRETTARATRNRRQTSRDKEKEHHAFPESAVKKKVQEVPRRNGHIASACREQKDLRKKEKSVRIPSVKKTNATGRKKTINPVRGNGPI